MYAAEDLAEVIKLAKKAAEETTNNLAQITESLEQAKNGADNIPVPYQRFLG